MLADISRTRFFYEADGAGGGQPQEPDEGAAPARPRVSPEEVLEGIHSLKGAEQFIDLCEEIHRMAPALRGAGLVDVLGDRSYLFSIDPGSGLNSAVNLFTSLFIAEGFVPPDFAPLQLTLPPGDYFDIGKYLIKNGDGNINNIRYADYKIVPQVEFRWE